MCQCHEGGDINKTCFNCFADDLEKIHDHPLTDKKVKEIINLLPQLQKAQIEL